MKNIYPTKEKILGKDPKIKKETINTILIWKSFFIKNWKNKPKEIKFTRLKILIHIITFFNYNKKVNVKKGEKDCYSPKTNTIYLNKENPSILSALHETAHALHGESELTACRWSIYLFRTCFPGLFSKLKWKGHLLIKQ